MLNLIKQETCEQLEEKVHQGEALLERIQAALQDIAQSQLDMQNPISDNIVNPNFNLMVANLKQESNPGLTNNVTNGHQSQEPSESPMTQ